MKRFHIHLAVRELETNIHFYSALFDQAPDRHEHDYAQWKLENPRLNFAISTRHAETGLAHLGFEANNAAELEQLRLRAQAAQNSAPNSTPGSPAEQILDEGNTTCCYAFSNKHWVIDPQGISWEHFQRLGESATYDKPVPPGEEQRHPACCAVTDTSSTGQTEDKHQCCER